MTTLSEMNSTQESLDKARIKLKEFNEIIFADKNKDSSAQNRRRPAVNPDLKRTISFGNHRDYDEPKQIDDDFPKIKSRVNVIGKDNNVITKREQVIAMQKSRKNDLARNKRMFGCLLGTLQKFRKEEVSLKPKEEKKAQIEKKLEEQEMQEKIKIKQEREALLANRKRKLLEVKVLEEKMNKLKDMQAWEDSKKHLVNFIKTSTKPEIYYLPKVMNPKTLALKAKSEQEVREMIEERRKQVHDEIKQLEEQVDKECQENSIKVDIKSEYTESENGREHDLKNENSERVQKRRRSTPSPDTFKKRIYSQIVVKSKE